jgi:hypothetical protein
VRSARPSDRVEAADAVRPGEPAAATELADGRLASAARRRSRRYQTAARLAALHDSLTDIDWAVLGTIERFGLVSGPQLTALHFGDDDNAGRAARRALRRLRQAEVLTVLERRIGGVRAGSSGLVYRLGQAGVRLVGGKRQASYEPGLHHLRHNLAVVEVLVTLRRAERAGALEVLAFEAEPVCWRTFTGRHGEPAVLKPDAYVELRLADRRRLWFVEVDRGTVSTASLERKLARYADYLQTGREQAAHGGAFPRVVWVAPNQRRAAHLKALCTAANRRLGAELHRLLAEEWQPP